MREIRTLRAMWRGLETTHGSDTEALSTETESKQSKPNLRSIGASPRPYRHLPEGRVDSETVVSSLDLFPTLCRMAGVTAPQVEFDGEDLTPAFSGRPMKRTKDLFWEYGRDASYAYPGKSWDKSPNLAMRTLEAVDQR